MMDILVSLIVLSEWWNMFETRGKKRDFRTSHTSSYSLRTPLVLPSYSLRTSSYSLRTPSYFLRTPSYSLGTPSYSLVLSRTPLYSPRTSLVLPRTSSCFLVFTRTSWYSLVLPSYFLRTSGVRKSRFFPLGLKSIGIFDILDIFLIVNCRKNVFHFINIVMKLLIVYLVKMKIIVNYYLVIINHHFVVRVVQNV